MRRAGPGLGPEYVGPGRASGLSTSGRAGPRAWVEDFGPGSGLEFRPVATSIMEILNRGHKDTRERVVHVNRLRLRYNRNTDFAEPSTNIQITRLLENNHNYSLLEQESEDIESNNSTQPVPRRSGRIRRLPQYLEDYVLD